MNLIVKKHPGANAEWQQCPEGMYPVVISHRPSGPDPLRTRWTNGCHRVPDLVAQMFEHDSKNA